MQQYQLNWSCLRSAGRLAGNSSAGMTDSAQILRARSLLKPVKPRPKPPLTKPVTELENVKLRKAEIALPDKHLSEIQRLETGLKSSKIKVIKLRTKEEVVDKENNEEGDDKSKMKVFLFFLNNLKK